VAIIYTASSLALAALEMLAGLPSINMLNFFKCIRVSIEEQYIQKLDSLPDGWNAIPAGSVSKKIGGDWAQKADFPVLEVPSVIIPFENNYLLNPNHPDFKYLQLGNPQEFTFDQRFSRKITITG